MVTSYACVQVDTFYLYSLFTNDYVTSYACVQVDTPVPATTCPMVRVTSYACVQVDTSCSVSNRRASCRDILCVCTGGHTKDDLKQGKGDVTSYACVQVDTDGH